MTTTELPRSRRRLATAAAFVALLVLASACSSSGDDSETSTSIDTEATTTASPTPTTTPATTTTFAPLDYPVLVDNSGGPLEGHTPTDFEGSGEGLFAGDNLNADFPDGSGVQLFLAFELPPGLVAGPAILRSDALSEEGTPFEDLGALRVHPVQFDEFGPELFEIQPVAEGTPCELTADTTIECDVTAMVAVAVAKDRPTLQLRLRFDTPADNDGTADLARFFRTDSNSNEPGIFTLTIEE